MKFRFEELSGIFLVHSEFQWNFQNNVHNAINS